MRFSIITPTYRRSDLLARAVSSLLKQTYSDWELIIVNDSPEDKAYLEFASSINDPRIHYHVNERNLGVNASRNKGLDKLSADSKWVIFLDDDDYFAPDALQTFHDLIIQNNKGNWLVTNRAYKNGQPITQFPCADKWYSYAWKYLILKRCKGDATHCIKTSLINNNQIKFSKNIKQGEEWFFFYQVGLNSKMYYYDHNSTITDGYDEKKGLNFRKRSRTGQIETVVVLGYEAQRLGFLYHASFIIYLLIRLIRVLVKN